MGNWEALEEGLAFGVALSWRFDEWFGGRGMPGLFRIGIWRRQGYGTSFIFFLFGLQFQRHLKASIGGTFRGVGA